MTQQWVSSPYQSTEPLNFGSYNLLGTTLNNSYVTILKWIRTEAEFHIDAIKMTLSANKISAEKALANHKATGMYQFEIPSESPRPTVDMHVSSG